MRDYSELKNTAMDADKCGAHIYTTARDSNNWKANQRFQAQSSPEVVYGLVCREAALREALQAFVSTFDKLLPPEARGPLYLDAIKALEL